MERFKDKNGEIFLLISETAFDFCVVKTIIRLKNCKSAVVEDYMAELCGVIFNRYPNERPEEIKERASKAINKLINKIMEG